ncbi:hypothetical protein FVEG_01205 [Fusarium verticillioides 7600]|uniref:Uncharacterized protein n=1 Tax=Gibberella moniliformis (strain M3125 / FGSC 7600) TaxID=334819 RepID=W7LQB1_GIBM7|nr:hypothetical protein FVEG_01205 [Fusarium verticillioides 7600]EWG37679.1 hypothetical protein FVEG_01205 [Fusarium verticillioides 7600]
MTQKEFFFLLVTEQQEQIPFWASTTLRLVFTCYSRIWQCAPLVPVPHGICGFTQTTISAVWLTAEKTGAKGPPQDCDSASQAQFNSGNRDVTAQQAKLLGVASLFVIRQARMLTACTATPSAKSGGKGD